MNQNITTPPRRVGRPRNPLNQTDPWRTLAVRRSTRKAFRARLNRLREAGAAKTADDALRLMLGIDNDVR